MTIGLLGRKIGMTRIFTAEGKSIPVSVVEVHPNRVSQLKSIESDGYNAVQLTGGTKKASHVNKPLAGHFAKAEIEAGDMLCEFRVGSIEDFAPGQIFTVSDVFNEGQYATHGNSRSHRVPGSIGQNQSPGRVFKGKKMAGHMGNKRCTVQTLELVRVDTERNLLLIKGAIPGAPGVRVEVKPAVKMQERGK